MIEQAAEQARRERVLVVCKDLPRYRVAFFEGLRTRLGESDVQLDLIYGQPAAEYATRRDSADIAWARKVRNLTMRVAGRTVYWQPVLRAALRYDLVIVEQANKLLVNYALWILDRIGLIRLGMWGHGRDFQSHSGRRFGESFKRWYSRRVSWWFAYNRASAAVVASLGYPTERTTIVQNAIDTTALAAQVLCARTSVNGDANPHKCLFVGAMYPEKRLQFLVDAAVLVRRAVPDFSLVLIGAGSDEGLAQTAASKHDWIQYVGPQFGMPLAEELASAALLLMPGAVGLGVLDSFAAGVPMVATSASGHGPEFEYLRDGVNGVVVDASASVDRYAETVIALLSDEPRRARLVRGCLRSAEEYTVEEMIRRFSRGVLEALDREIG